ncbi:ABC transporter ATP-binding protein [Rhizobium wuzhouense]|uniref:ABC transporter ATP-binding protein n=1 Tax=Rhizobium wuzhouense TaxID=1986026 RepID=A0ABX5NP34_9HYPH|nr:ABC transporter ATP-binding protein [Rhizobium wuzhouense]PYB72279.1 ABC transporter ATP-binding protein [Rhizobium wuzhouense]
MPETKPDFALSLQNVTAGYGQTHILRNLSLRIIRGERVAVIGRNGAGKTTMLSTVMGLTRLHGGRVSLGEEDISRLSPHQRSMRGLGLVPQTRDIFASLTVEENLTAVMRGKSTLDEAYALFPRLKERRRNGGTQLSGGEQQMLTIARTLMTEPDVVLLDEPLEGLAPVICEQLMQAFEQLAADGRRTVVLVEQHASAALAFATRAIVITNGSIVYDDSAAALKQQPELLERHIGVARG